VRCSPNSHQHVKHALPKRWGGQRWRWWLGQRRWPCNIKVLHVPHGRHAKLISCHPLNAIKRLIGCDLIAQSRIFEFDGIVLILQAGKLIPKRDHFARLDKIEHTQPSKSKGN
jgi:hypothetical protein